MIQPGSFADAARSACITAIIRIREAVTVRGHQRHDTARRRQLVADHVFQTGLLLSGGRRLRLTIASPHRPSSGSIIASFRSSPAISGYASRCPSKSRRPETSDAGTVDPCRDVRPVQPGGSEFAEQAEHTTNLATDTIGMARPSIFPNRHAEDAPIPATPTLNSDRTSRPPARILFARLSSPRADCTS